MRLLNKIEIVNVNLKNYLQEINVASCQPSIRHSPSQQTSQLDSQSVRQSVSQSFSESFIQSVAQSVSQSVTHLSLSVRRLVSNQINPTNTP